MATHLCFMFALISGGTDNLSAMQEPTKTMRAIDIEKIKRQLSDKKFQFSPSTIKGYTAPKAITDAFDKGYICSTILSPDYDTGSFELRAPDSDSQEKNAKATLGTGIYVWKGKYYHSKNLKYITWGSVAVGNYIDRGLLYQRGDDPFFIFVSVDPLQDGTFKMYIKDAPLNGATGSFALFQFARRYNLK